MATKIGIVASVDTAGQFGQFTENSTGALIDYIIHKPGIYVVPGDSVQVVVSNPSGRAINPPIVIDINGKPI